MSRIPLLKVRGLVESFIWSSQRRKRHWQRGKCGLCRVTSAAQGPGTCQPPIFHTSRRLLLIFRLSRERKRVGGKKGFSFSFFPTFQIILWFFFFTYLFIRMYIFGMGQNFLVWSLDQDWVTNAKWIPYCGGIPAFTRVACLSSIGILKFSNKIRWEFACANLKKKKKRSKMYCIYSHMACFNAMKYFWLA